jgi:hypothetical protein
MKYLFLFIALAFITLNLKCQNTQDDKPQNITRWTGSFTYTVTYTDNWEAAACRTIYNWGFSGKLDLVKSDEFDNAWRGEAQDFTGNINDRVFYDSLKYSEVITANKLIENYNSAYLKLDYETMTYTFNLNIGDYEKRYQVTIPPEIEAVKNDTLGFFFLALVEDARIEKEALIDNFSFRTGVKDKSFSPQNMQINYSGVAKTNYDLSDLKPLEGKLTFTLSPVMNEPEITVTTNKITNPHCLCNDSIVEFSARTNSSGGKFEKFEIEYLGVKTPKIVKNEGGSTPVLVIKATGETSGKIKVTAVYTKDNNTFKSKPYEMNFCKVEKPKIEETENLATKYQYIFSDTKNDNLRIKLTSRIFYNGETINNGDISGWYMSPEESYLSEEPATEGIGITYRAEKLPENNSSFGKKRVKLDYQEYDCNCTSEETEIEIFYPRDAKNNPDGTIPNWAYYWNKTSAKTNYKFDVVPKIPDDKTIIALPGFACLGLVLDSYNTGVVARYDPFKGKIWVPENLPVMNCPSRPDGTKYEGIDCFAQVIRHEGRHKDQLISWWGPNMANYNCIDDVDGDFLPNAVEMATEGCNSLLPWSCPGRPTWLGTVFDVDIDAYEYGWKWNPGDADKEDWSAPGRQF